MDDETLRKYHMSHTNMLKVLKYRGYSETLIDPCIYTREEFDNTYKNYDLEDMKTSMSDGMTFEQDNKPTTIIVWLLDLKLGANISEINSKLEELNATHALVVADNGVTPQAKETIRNLRGTKKFIDVWTLQESMVFNPDHIKVPKHRICSTKEKNEIFMAYGLKGPTTKLEGSNIVSNGHSLPCLSTTDPMTKFLGATKGQLIEIIRVSETDPTSSIKTYRMVY